MAMVKLSLDDLHRLAGMITALVELSFVDGLVERGLSLCLCGFASDIARPGSERLLDENMRWC
jgi:hypothetical protein